MSRRVVVSGGFDPLHVGHINLIEYAAGLGYVTAIVDSDAYVGRKHRVLLPQASRMKLVAGLRHVDKVVAGTEDDGDCSRILQKLHPYAFVVGPDYHDHSRLPEYRACTAGNILMQTAGPLVKDYSSSEMVRKISNPPVCVSAIVIRYGRRPGGGVLIGTRDTPDGHGCDDLLGGFVEPGESLEAAIKREAKEEAKIDVAILRYIGSKPGVYSDGRKVLVACFVCATRDEPQPTAEMSSFRWVNETSPNMHQSCDKDFLDLYFTGRSLQ